MITRSYSTASAADWRGDGSGGGAIAQDARKPSSSPRAAARGGRADLSMPKLSGVTALQRIREACSATRVIVLSMHTSRQMVVDALAAGACGYVTKHCPTMRSSGHSDTAKNVVYLSSDVRGYNLTGSSPVRGAVVAQP